MFGKKGRNLVGLDIGSSAIKAIELTEEGDDVIVTGYGFKGLTADDQGRKAEVIREVMEQAGIRTTRVATAVSGRSVIVRYVNMQTMDDNELKNAIKYEAEKYIPFDVNEVVMDCQRIDPVAGREAAGEMRVLLVAVKRNVIEEHYKLLQAAGLNSILIDVDVFALGNSYELQSLAAAGKNPREKVIAIVDIGASKADINIIRGTVSQFTREIYLGGNDCTEALAKKWGVEPAAAEEKKQEADTSEDIRQALTPILDDLANEINLSFDYYENQFDQEVDAVYLSGGLAGLSFLAEYFSKSLGKSCTRWNPLENIRIDASRVSEETLAQHYNRLAVSLGLAARIKG